MDMKPDYVVKKSAWDGVTPLCVVFFWLIIPLFIMIGRILAAKAYRLEFYDNDIIVTKTGFFNQKETKDIFESAYVDKIEQSLWGKIFNYGTVRILAEGGSDLVLKNIKDPRGLEKFIDGSL